MAGESARHFIPDQCQAALRIFWSGRVCGTTRRVGIRREEKSSVQFKAVSKCSGKCICPQPRYLGSVSNVALETVPVFVCTESGPIFCPVKVDRGPIPYASLLYHPDHVHTPQTETHEMGWATSAAWKSERITKALLYGELVTGKRPTGRPQLRYKDTCKRDPKAPGINTVTWETAAADMSTWKQEVKKGLSRSPRREPDERRKGHGGRHNSTLKYRQTPSPAESGRENATPALVSSATPDDAETDEHSRIGLLGHTRRR